MPHCDIDFGCVGLSEFENGGAGACECIDELRVSMVRQVVRWAYKKIIRGLLVAALPKTGLYRQPPRIE